MYLFKVIELVSEGQLVSDRVSIYILVILILEFRRFLLFLVCFLDRGGVNVDGFGFLLLFSFYLKFVGVGYFFVVQGEYSVFSIYIKRVVLVKWSTFLSFVYIEVWSLAFRVGF